MRVLAITQARIGSTRLPAKVLKEVNGQTLLEIHLRRIRQSQLVDDMVVATTKESGADRITQIAAALGARWYRGSTDDVLERFYLAAQPIAPEYVVRLTSDCPLVDPALVDTVIGTIKADGSLDYVSNTLHPTYPDGMDVEVFRFRALERAFRDAVLKSDREHVTPYLRRNSTVAGGSLFRSASVEGRENYSHVRLTVDEQEDLEVVQALIEALGADQPWQTYVDWLHHHPEVAQVNRRFARNEGYRKSLEQDGKT